MGTKCPYPAIYENLNSALPRGSADGRAPLLPIDGDGSCIFHSKDLEWKRANDFKMHFQKLLEILEADEMIRDYDFAEFQFVGDTRGSSPSAPQHVFNIADSVCKQQAYFISAVFHDAIDIKDTNFKNGVRFDNAAFYHDISFRNVSFQGSTFSNTIFQRKVRFSNVEFLTYALFENGNFTGNTAGYVVKFEDCQFEGITDFSGIIFNPDGKECSMGFHNVQFENVTDFKNAEFHNQIVFADVSFASMTEFTDALFGTASSSARYRGVAVEFNRIEVLGEAVLRFNSLDPLSKLFNHDVQISFKNAPKGLIQFENVNYKNLTSQSQERLAKYIKSGNVEIGSGCIKYRFQTEIRTIEISQGNAPLILELCQTFTNYFTASNAVNLGFEVVERDKNKVSFFYFTDENISEDDFLKRLAKTEQELWSLLATIPKGEQYIALTEDTSKTPQAVRDHFINVVDGISALLGTFFRVGTRISCGSWTTKDTEALLSSVRFNNTAIGGQAQNLHKVLVDKYTSDELLAFNLQQNGSLFVQQNNTINFSGPNSRVNINSEDHSTNITDGG